MGPNYSDFYEPAIEEAFTTAGIVGIFLIIWLTFLLVTLLLSATSYVLSALGMYTIAKRRGIKNPWLSWVPVCNTWILGSISDQYQYVAKGKVCNRRKLLLGLQIGVFATTLIMQIINIINIALTTFGSSEVLALGLYLIILGIALIMMVVAIANSVFMYIAYYDLFRSCNPDNAVLFLVLSIVVSFALPVLVLLCRNKDLGMPPLKTEDAEIVDATETEIVEATETEIVDAPLDIPEE